MNVSLRRGAYIADVFAGEGSVANKVRRQGFNAREWDTVNHKSQDLTCEKVRGKIKHDIKNGLCLGLMFAPPCTTWSVARSRRHPLRSKKFARGLPKLAPEARAEVRLGNRVLDACLDLIDCADRARTPWILENPIGSFMFHDDKLQKRASRRTCDTTVVDQCLFGAAWRKRTRLLLGNIDAQDACKLDCRCSSRSGFCDRTGRPHVVLQGRGENGLPRTSAAQTYPAAMSHALASTLLSLARSFFLPPTPPSAW